MSIEPYEVAVPEPDPWFDLKASGISIGRVTEKENLLIVDNIQQKVFVPDMITGVTSYADSKGYDVSSILYNPDYERFEFNLVLRLNS